MRTSATTSPCVAAIVVAAGLSRRMGAFKLTLPWADKTVIEQVVFTLSLAPLHEIIVVTGHRGDEVVKALAKAPVRCVPNPQYESGEMLSSVRAGLAAMAASVDAALICLGDQPQMELLTVLALLTEAERTGWRRVIIPSYDMHAGHPIVLPRSLWTQIMNTSKTLRDVLRSNASVVNYLTVDTPSILADLDTPDDYQQAKP